MSQIVAALSAAAIAMIAVPASAGAAEYVVRPDKTIAVSSWGQLGSGETHTLLDEGVVQPAAPYLFWDLLYASGNGAYSAEVGLAAPAIPAGETVTSVTSYAYLAAGSNRDVKLEVLSGATVLASTTVPAGTSARWHSVSVSTPTPEQLADLRLRVSLDGGAGSGETYFHATYATVTTDAPAVDGGSIPLTGGGSGVVTPPEVPAAVVLNVSSLPLAASGVLAVPVTCQLSTGCAGTVTTRLVDSAASSARRRKVRAKRFRLKPGAKKKVPVVLDRRSARVVKRKGRARVKLTIAIEGAPTVTKVVTVLERRRAMRHRRAAKAPRRSRSGR